MDINSIFPYDSAYYEEELLFDPPPKEVRSRAHIEKILNVETKASDDQLNQATLKKLKKIYEESIVPLESTYKYKELSHRWVIFCEKLIFLSTFFKNTETGPLSIIVNNY